MEIHPGVFVSNVRPDTREPDPEVGGEMHILCSDVGVEAGLSRFHGASGPVEWTLPARETSMILERGARIEISDRPTLELRAGDIASLPAGTRTTWHLSLPFKQFWVIQR